MSLDDLLSGIAAVASAAAAVASLAIAARQRREARRGRSLNAATLPWEGLTADEVIVQLVQSHPDIRQVKLVNPRRAALVQERVTTDVEWIEAARRIRNRDKIPFWDAVVTLAAERGQPEWLRSAIAHHEPHRELAVFSAEELTPDQLREAATRVPEDRVLAISSVVKKRDGSKAHIPMLDLRFPPDERTKALAQELLSVLEMDGVLLNSGSSFHFYKLSVLEPNELPDFLGKALLLGSLIDQRWIAHQLIEGECALRVLPGNGSHEPSPVVIGTVSAPPAMANP